MQLKIKVLRPREFSKKLDRMILKLIEYAKWGQWDLLQCCRIFIGVALAHRHTERDYQTQGFGLDIVIIMSIITKYC